MIPRKTVFSDTALLLTCLLLVACKLWLVGPHELVALKMPHDDLLFVTLAENIIQGKWLGEYNQLTLIKGPFYPLFIAAAYYLDIPLLAAQQLLYAFACFVVIWALYPAVRSRGLLLLIFLFLLGNPFSFNYPAVGRVFRLGIYQSLGLLVFASALGLYLRLHLSRLTATCWGVMTGLALSAFWHTREESIWIVPSLLLLFAAAIYANRHLGRLRLSVLTALLLLPVVIALGATITLRTLNYSHYGIFATIELETPQFESAYGGLLRIKSDKWQRFFPVVRDVREQAYKVSPTFRQLQPFLEGDQGKKWLTPAFPFDMPAAYFVWAFRDAVAYSGYYKDGPGTMEFYQKMGEEIDRACEQKQLDCRPRITSLVPTWHREYNRLFFPSYLTIFRRIISFNEASADTRGIMSKGPAELMQRYDRVTREKLRTSRKDILRGYPAYHSHLNREKTRLLTDIGSFYQATVPVLFVISAVILLLFALVPSMRQKMSCYVPLGLSLIVGLGAITFILTLVAITSYPSIHRAMHVSYPLVLLVIISAVLALDDFFTPAGKERIR